MPQQWFVYILWSLRDRRFYIGESSNVNKRLAMHNSGLVVSTKNRRPLELVRIEGYANRAEALKREKYLKSLKGGNEFKKIISTKRVDIAG